MIDPGDRCISDGHLECLRRKPLLLVEGRCNWCVRSLKESMLLRQNDLFASFYNRSYKNLDFVFVDSVNFWQFSRTCYKSLWHVLAISRNLPPQNLFENFNKTN